MKIYIKRLHPDARVPAYMHPGEDAAFDVFAVEQVDVHPGTVRTIRLGIASEIPDGYWVELHDKSGLARKHGIGLLGRVIDSGYRGEWAIVVCNHGEHVWTVNPGDPVAQAVVHERIEAEFEITNTLGESKRGLRGFTSGQQH